VRVAIRAARRVFCLLSRIYVESSRGHPLSRFRLLPEREGLREGGGELG